MTVMTSFLHFQINRRNQNIPSLRYYQHFCKNNIPAVTHKDLDEQNLRSGDKSAKGATSAAGSRTLKNWKHPTLADGWNQNV